MYCSDCGVNQGGKVRVLEPGKGWRTLRLCQPCGESRIADGDTIEDYGDWEQERDERRADEILADR